MHLEMPYVSVGSPKARYRALFYVFDGGSGIGHLRRLARIAEAMQEEFSCLIITGHDAAPQWMVPQGCEYVRLPAWDNLIASKAAYWERKPFVDVSLEGAVHLRQSMLEGVFRGFQPDVLLVDHLPLGAYQELTPFLRSEKCLKYLVTRGIQNETEDLQKLVLAGSALKSLLVDYSKILSAIDPQVFDLAANYGLSAEVAQKIVATGYVAPLSATNGRATTRAARGIGDDVLWVIVSVGGGQWGERLIEACLALVNVDVTVHFDIVMGPRSRLARPCHNPELLEGGRVRLHAACPELAAMHSAADLVITTGGYNSLLEALQGQARVLCVPYRTDASDEPMRHAEYLKRMVDLQVETDFTKLPALFARTLRRCKAGPARDRRVEISMNGASRINHFILSDILAASQYGK